jgi:hypothetical protein
MRADIRSFGWDDLLIDPRTDRPINLVMIVGPLDGPGDEIFQITVCTAEALKVLLDRDGIVVGLHLLLVAGLNPSRIEAFLEDRVRRLDADTWLELAAKIGRIGYWEFED